MAKKVIYESRLNQIKDIKQSRNKDHLVDWIVGVSKQVNQRLYRLEKAGVGVGDTAYRYAQLETGKDKPRYTESKSVLGKLSNEELYNRALQLNEKLMSRTSTVSGIHEVTENRLNQSIGKLEEKIENQNINKEEFDRFLKSGGGELMNSKYYDSYQIVEDWLEWTSKGLTSKEVIDEFKKQKKKADRYSARGKDYDIDIGKIKRSFSSLATRKRMRRKR